MSKREYPVAPFVREHEFNRQMRERRLALGYGFQRLADKIGSGSRSYLREIEMGRHPASIELGLEICQVLQIPIHICVDYICTVEQERIQKSIRRAYGEWLESVPDEVKSTMLADENSQLVHKTLIGESEDETIQFRTNSRSFSLDVI